MVDMFSRVEHNDEKNKFSEESFEAIRQEGIRLDSKLEECNKKLQTSLLRCNKTKVITQNAFSITG